MWNLFKRDLWNHWPFILFSFVFVFIIYMLQWTPPNGYLFMYLLLFLCASMFYSDHKKHTNRFLISLPVLRIRLVLSRFIFIVSLGYLFLIYVWMLDFIFFQSININVVNLLIGFLLFNVIIAISLPIYYTVNFLAAACFQLAIMAFISFMFSLLAYSPNINFDHFHTIDLQLMIYFLVSIIGLVMSFYASNTIFAKKDIA